MTTTNNPAGGIPGVTVQEMSEAEAAMAFGETEEEGAEEASAGPQERFARAMGANTPTQSQNGASGRLEGMPEWATLPQGFVIPPGKRLVWMRFRAEWTDSPQKGERWCLMWQLSLAEEKTAYKRAQGGGEHRALEELTKQSIRVIDGVKVDRTGTLGPGNVALWFEEVGLRCRQLVENAYLQSHTLTKEQLSDFFVNCFVSNTSTAG